MNILINNTVSYSKECMGMKSLHYFCDNCVVYDLREIMTGKTHNERNQIKKRTRQQMIPIYILYTCTIPSVWFKNPLFFNDKLYLIKILSTCIFEKNNFFTLSYSTE